MKFSKISNKKRQECEELIRVASLGTGYLFGVLDAPRLWLQDPAMVNFFLESF